MAWDDEKRDEAVKLYLEQNPTEENTLEIVKQVAEDLGESPNGVRTILNKKGVYIKAAIKGATPAADKKPRVSKEDQQNELKDAIKDVGQEIDDGIINRLSGKAAKYLADIINSTQE